MGRVLCDQGRRLDNSQSIDTRVKGVGGAAGLAARCAVGPGRSDALLGAPWETQSATVVVAAVRWV
jgi:hypothetical protein